MSMYQLTGVRSKSPTGSFLWSSKRFLHRSPDFRYLQIWKRSAVHFQEHYQNIYFYPKLVNQILRATAISQIQGFVPFIHAVPASMNVVQKVWGLSGLQKGIRSPVSHYATRSYEEALQEIPTRLIKAPKPGILSMSYGLTSGSKNLETAASWGFANHHKTAQCELVAEEFFKSLQAFGISSDSYFWQKGRHLIYQYAQLNVGDFFVINIPPDMVERYVIDSKPYNFPTGRKALDVALHPENYENDLFEEPHTHMASLLLCRDTLGPRSKISWVHANSSSEVEQLCRNVLLQPMHEIPVFDGLTMRCAARLEEEYMAQRKILDRDLEIYIHRLKRYLDRDPEVYQEQFEEVPDVSWYMGYMI